MGSMVTRRVLAGCWGTVVISLMRLHAFLQIHTPAEKAPRQAIAIERADRVRDPRQDLGNFLFFLWRNVRAQTGKHFCSLVTNPRSRTKASATGHTAIGTNGFASGSSSRPQANDALGEKAFLGIHLCQVRTFEAFYAQVCGFGGFSRALIAQCGIGRQDGSFGRQLS